MILYHYCCSHSLKGIQRDGYLAPHPQVQLGGTPLVWLTDLDAADRAALGLSSTKLQCDRTEHRIVVDTETAIHWPRYARRLTRELRLIEESDGALPMHWYVSEHPVPVAASSETDKAGG